MYQTFLLDLDGVLVDSELLIKESFKHVLAKHNLNDHPDREKMIGKGLLNQYKLVCQSIDPEILCNAHNEFQNCNLHTIHPYPDVLRTLEALKGKGIKIAVVSNRSNNARAILDICKITPFIDHVISCEDVKNLKPDPEGILKALEALKAPKEGAVMVGDTEVDVLAGKAAGIATIGIDRDVCSEELAMSRPNYVVKNFADILAFAK